MNRLGPPQQTAQWICQDPWLRLGRPLFKHLPEQLSGDAQHGTARHGTGQQVSRACHTVLTGVCAWVGLVKDQASSTDSSVYCCCTCIHD